MSNAIQLFDFEGNAIRMGGTPDEPWFIAKDVCGALGLDNNRQAVADFDEDELITVTINDGNRGNPNMVALTEPGLYRLIGKSRKPEAKRFKRWVNHEVLPSIRKTGSYNLPSAEMKGLAIEGNFAFLSCDRAERLEQLEFLAKSSYIQMMASEQMLCLAVYYIRHERLWEDHIDREGKPRFTGFADYCEKHLGISKSSGYNRVMAGEVLLSLKFVPEPWKPKSIDALMALSSFEVEQREQILGHIADKRQEPTRPSIEEAVQELNAADLENTLQLNAETPESEGARRHSSAGKVDIKFSLDEDLKEPLFQLAKTRQMSVSTLMANLAFRELREAQGLGEVPQFNNIPWYEEA